MECNVIFDGNYLFHKTKSIFMSYNRYTSVTEAFEELETRAQFLRKLITDFCRAVNNIEPTGKVIIIFDQGSSWRKTYYEGYKKKEADPLGIDDTKGWEHFYDIMDKFRSLFEKRGFIVSFIDSFEGDDLCYFWVKHLEATSDLANIVITGDGDIHQLISNKTSVYNNNSTINECFSIDGKVSINDKVKSTAVDPKEHLFRKILGGDSGDKVPNIIRGIGEKAVDKLTDQAKSFDLLDCSFEEEDYVNLIATLVQNNFKKQPLLPEVIGNMKRNLKLMWLNDYVYTPEQKKLATDHIKKVENNFSYEREYNLGELLKQEK